MKKKSLFLLTLCAFPLLACSSPIDDIQAYRIASDIVLDIKNNHLDNTDRIYKQLVKSKTQVTNETDVKNYVSEYYLEADFKNAMVMSRGKSKFVQKEITLDKETKPNVKEEIDEYTMWSYVDGKNMITLNWDTKNNVKEKLIEPFESETQAKEAMTSTMTAMIRPYADASNHAKNIIKILTTDEESAKPLSLTFESSGKGYLKTHTIKKLSDPDLGKGFLVSDSEISNNMMTFKRKEFQGEYGFDVSENYINEISKEISLPNPDDFLIRPTE